MYGHIEKFRYVIEDFMSSAIIPNGIVKCYLKRNQLLCMPPECKKGIEDCMKNNLSTYCQIKIL